MLMEESGFTRETVEEWQEKKTSSFLYNLYMSTQEQGRFPTRFIWQRRRSLTSWQIKVPVLSWVTAAITF